MQPLVNPALEVHSFDSGSEEPRMLCEVPAKAGGRVRFSVPVPVVELVRRCDGDTPIDELVAAHCRDHGSAHTEEQVTRLFTDFLIPNGFVSSRAEVAPDTPAKRRGFLHVRLPFLGAGVVDPVAQRLTWMFSAPFVAVWLVVFLACQSYFFLRMLPAQELDFNSLDSIRFLALMALTTVSALMHELGHAAAAARFGCGGFQIGWGLYLMFTVFYADVSAAWRLPRRQRVVVDVGGIYFQALFLVVMCVGWGVTGDALFVYGFLLTEFTLATALNPFLRLDGYWLVSDLAGIPNLRQTSLRFLGEVGSGLRRRRLELPRIGLRPRTAVVLALYSLFGLVFFLWLARMMVDRIAFSLIAGYPAMFGELVATLRHSPLPWLDLLSTGFELLWRTVLLVGLGILILRFVRLVGSKLMRWVESSRSRGAASTTAAPT